MVPLFRQNIGLTFHVDVSASKPWFQIPKSVAELFSLKSGDLLAVSISTPKGKPIYHGFAKLDSATTPYKMHIGRPLVKGKEIRVTASRPPAGQSMSMTAMATG